MLPKTWNQTGKHLLTWMLTMFLLFVYIPSVQAEEIQKTHYSIDMTLEMPEGESLPEGAMLHEKLSVKVVNTSDQIWNELCFRDYVYSVIQEHNSRGDAPSGLTSGILSASCEGQALEIRIQEEEPSILFVSLNKPLNPGESTVVEMEYAAGIPMGAYRLGVFSMSDDFEKLTFELGQFYPVLAVMEEGQWVTGEYFTDGECFYSQCADYDLTVRVPEGYQVIASGEEQLLEETVWKVEAHNMRDVTLIVTNELEMVSGEYDGVVVNSYFAPGDDGLLRQGELSLEAAIQSAKAFTEAYGPYPYDELDVVESSYEFGGMEAPGLVRISTLYSWFISDDAAEGERVEYTKRLQASVSHEVAHEWFYAVVGNDQYHEAWLDESFASYSEQVYWRSMGRDEKEIEAAMAEFESSIPSSGNETVDRSYAELTSGTDYDYIQAVYQRGAAFLYQLERALGQEEFFRFMREYYGEFAFHEVHTEDFIRLLAPFIAENTEAQALVDRYLSKY